MKDEVKSRFRFVEICGVDKVDVITEIFSIIVDDYYYPQREGLKVWKYTTIKWDEKNDDIPNT